MSPTICHIGVGRAQEGSRGRCHEGRRDIDESAALTRKLQELVNGGTADLVIGDSFLSRMLRGVPMMDTNGGGKYMYI